MELPEEDVPPEEIWHSEDRLREWFDSVRQRRDDKLRGYESVPEADEEEEMTGNTALAGLLGERNG